MVVPVRTTVTRLPSRNHRKEIAVPDPLGHPSADEMQLGEVLRALGDPLRRQMVAALADLPDGSERTCASVAPGIAKSTLSHHVKVLREAGLVQQINRGNSRKMTLRRHDVESRFPGLLALVAADEHPSDADS
jgi:DNA-binding transcriptional ArsR family regulator